MLYSVLVAIDVLLAIGIIGLILIQHGKGADVGAAFGSGASGTVFGSKGSASFLTRLTAILVTAFFINSLVLAYLASNQPTAESVIQDADVMIEQEIDTEVDGSKVEELEDSMSEVEEDVSTSAEGELTDVPAAETAEQSVTEIKDKVSEKIEEMTEDLPLDDVPE